MTSNEYNADVKIGIDYEIDSCSTSETDTVVKNEDEKKGIYGLSDEKRDIYVLDVKNDGKEDIYDFHVKNIPEYYKGTYDTFVDEILTLSSVPILKSLPEESIRNFKHYNTRYYEDKYCVNFGVAERGYYDINIRVHSNKLFLIALASGNDIVRNQKDISEINFVVNNIDRSNIQLRGKKKMGSKGIEPHTILCQVKYQGDERMYNIRAGVKGRIIEINELIKTNPNFIRTDPKGLGFIAVVVPQGKPADYEKQISKLNLLNEEEYCKYLLQRVPQL